MRSFKSRQNIMVIEDNQDCQEILQNVLEESYNITVVSNTQEALLLLMDAPTTYSLILLELDLPDSACINFLKQRNNQTFLQSIPVIVITGDGNDNGCYKLGADEFIRKPLNTPDIILARCVRTMALFENKNLVQQTERDKLSGLYTIDYFFEYLKQIIPLDMGSDRDAIVIDIEHFRLINEIYGRSVGDQILADIGNYLQQILTTLNAIACRAGADVFYVYCIHQESYQELQEDLQDILAHHVKVNNIRARVGVWQFVERGVTDPETWFDRAKSACDRISGNFTVSVATYNSGLHTKHLREERLIRDIYEAIEHKDLKVYYQPKYAIQGDKPHLRSAEALIRWIHPTLGFISPADFIPLFESNGLIQMVDYYVWKEAAAQIRRWKDEYDFTVPVSVNVSRIDIYDPDLENKFCNILKENNLSPSEYMIEITESAYAENAQGLIEVLESMRQKGFKIEMDDFGTGYSSLGMLTEIPIDILKIDMSFVRSMEKHEKNKRMVELIIDIAKFLKVPCVAEGVETESQLRALRRMGCDVIQGYFFSKPVSPEDFVKFIEKEKSLWTK
ncbi:EAL domain-containing response regulator [Fibrobacter succinogenes]|uniref:two-component system response regulator n=1 Tax=Fibrobacter succinogenes TaxID=833 RepID=UPI0013D3ADA7|nr:EAL domain-containing response regulator [Fibrobacter succinogenes]